MLLFVYLNTFPAPVPLVRIPSHLICLATMNKNPEALDLMLRNKAFERLQGLYVKVVNGKPVIVNLSADKKSKLQPQGLHIRFVCIR